MEVYLPSPAEIRRECQRIRRTWPDLERQSRCAWAVEAATVIVPTAIDDDDSFRFIDSPE